MLLTSLLFAQLSFAGPNKSVCSARELKRQDCRLNVGAHTVRLLLASIAREDGVWHTVDEMPLKGEWEKMRFEIVSGRPILQLWIWDAGSGESPVQALHWYVTEIGKEKMKILAEGVVRRRRVKDGKPGTYIYDAWEKHDLKSTKAGLEWWLGTQKKELKHEH